MSARRNKRRRIDTDLDSIASEQPHSSPLGNQLEPEDDLDHPGSLSPLQVPPEELDVEAFAKEREIWDAFREEHYERASSSFSYRPPLSATPTQSSSSCPSRSIAHLLSFRSWTNKPKVRLLFPSSLPNLTNPRSLFQPDTCHSQICFPSKSIGRRFRQPGPSGLDRGRWPASYYF